VPSIRSTLPSTMPSNLGGLSISAGKRPRAEGALTKEKLAGNGIRGVDKSGIFDAKARQGKRGTTLRVTGKKDASRNQTSASSWSCPKTSNYRSAEGVGTRNGRAKWAKNEDTTRSREGIHGRKELGLAGSRKGRQLSPGKPQTDPEAR